MSDYVFQHTDETQEQRAHLTRDRVFGDLPNFERLKEAHLTRYGEQKSSFERALLRKKNSNGGYYWLRAWSARIGLPGHPRYVTWWSEGRGLRFVESDDRELDPFIDDAG